nr:MAG TPA: hypothetical protein [Caudoviricetes sp.]
MDSFINEARNNGLDVTNDNIAAVVNLINDSTRNLEKLIKKDKKMNEELKIVFGTNSNPELEQLIADRYILEGLLRKAVNKRSAY